LGKGEKSASSGAAHAVDGAARTREPTVEDLRQFFSLSLDMVCIAGGDGYFKWLNPAFEETLGWSVEELTTRPYVEFVHPDDLAATLREVERQTKAGESVLHFENRYRHRDGSWRVLAWKSVPKGDLMYAVARDVTERNELERALHAANAELEHRVVSRTAALETEIGERRSIEAQLAQAQKMEAIGNLTGGMAHDFNNLLGVIIGNLDLLTEQQGIGDRPRELAQEALDAALRGADLTQRLLAFARRQPLQPKRIDVNDLAGRIGKLLSRTVGETVEIRLDLDRGAWPVVADPAQLESSIVNIVNNARDAMPKGGLVMIATSNRHLDDDYAHQHAGLEAGDYTLIEISDTGGGMPPEIVERIFEPFFTTKEQGKGTGLGLSMVFGFMKQSGGHINVYSEPGVGTTFRLYLPRAVGAADAADIQTPTAPERGGIETVLAVEDNAGLRRVVARQLKELGYRLLEAEDGPSALRMLESDKVDLLFTDVVMPGGMNGYELARAAQARWPGLKVVLTSGFPETKLNGNGETPSHIRLLSKPYRKADLARTLREVLDG
jgi:PAS domain S-box-containing protein